MNINDTFLDQEVGIYKALAHPVRLKMVQLLISQKISVNEFSERLNKRQSNISQHLMMLKKVGLVFANKLGKRRVYQLDKRWIPVLKQISEFAK